jgi:hypothetical protein
MPDGLYERDILFWSQNQAELLRRLARGERVNDVDWEHVVEEIEDVGLSELTVHRWIIGARKSASSRRLRPGDTRYPCGSASTS